jgi:geranylgeranyl pyrophosphate synthase
MRVATRIMIAMDDFHELEAQMKTLARIVDPYIENYLDPNRSGIGGRPGEIVGDLISHAYYYPSLGGKRIRPITAMMAGQLFGKIHKSLCIGATSLELVHNFTLIHDDIMDRDKIRRGAKTAHEAFGVNEALNTGDYLFAKAMSVACEAERLANAKGVAESIANTVTKVAIGQELDIKYENVRDIRIPEYLTMIENKTASLFECAAQIGGILGGFKDGNFVTANTKQARALKLYGMNLGLAFQIHDDYLGCFGEMKKTGKPVGNDIRRGKESFVVVAALESASKSQRERLEAVLGNEAATEGELSSVVRLLKSMGIDDMCQELGRKYARKATSTLVAFGHSKPRELLSGMCQYAVARES